MPTDKENQIALKNKMFKKDQKIYGYVLEDEKWIPFDSWYLMNLIDVFFQPLALFQNASKTMRALQKKSNKHNYLFFLMILSADRCIISRSKVYISTYKSIVCQLI